jgi:hypothetical protein
VEREGLYIQVPKKGLTQMNGRGRDVEPDPGQQFLSTVESATDVRPFHFRDTKKICTSPRELSFATHASPIPARWQLGFARPESVTPTDISGGTRQHVLINGISRSVNAFPVIKLCNTVRCVGWPLLLNKHVPVRKRSGLICRYYSWLLVDGWNESDNPVRAASLSWQPTS